MRLREIKKPEAKLIPMCEMHDEQIGRMVCNGHIVKMVTILKQRVVVNITGKSCWADPLPRNLMVYLLEEGEEISLVCE